jgi:hypothetical protein
MAMKFFVLAVFTMAAVSATAGARKDAAHTEQRDNAY